jgi:hypothetical protein
MTQTTYKPYTIDELLTLIYEENLQHFEDTYEDSDKDNCDCHIHTTVKTIVQYWGE